LLIFNIVDATVAIQIKSMKVTFISESSLRRLLSESFPTMRESSESDDMKETPDLNNPELTGYKETIPAKEKSHQVSKYKILSSSS